MRAAVLHGPGPPDAFVLEDVPTPRPGRDEVLVKVEACGVSYRDVAERNGTYKREGAVPSLLGPEASGPIAATGEDVVRKPAGEPEPQDGGETDNSLAGALAPSGAGG